MKTSRGHVKNLKADLATRYTKAAARARLSIYMIHGAALDQDESYRSFLALGKTEEALITEWGQEILLYASDIAERVKAIRRGDL